MSAVNGPLLLRLAILAFVTVLLQLMFFAQVPVFGAIADLSPLIVMAVGLLCGPVAGASVGFAIGLMVDTALLQTMGLSSLVLIAVGYYAGRLREVRDPQGTLAPVALGAGAAAIATIGYGVGQFLLGSEQPFNWPLVSATLSTIVLDALIAMPVVALVRRWLTPVLPEDPRRRRRRAYTTGGLSPLHRA
ncbi:MAG: rod shape-determining protein MreD [Solirubrobacteraceae bacterium]